MMLGITRPGEVDHATSVLDRLRLVAHQPVPDPVGPDTPLDQVDARLRESALAAAARLHAQTIFRDVERATAVAIREAYTSAAVELLTALQKRSEAPTAMLAAAAEVLGADDTAESVVTRDIASVEAWRRLDQLDTAAADLDAVQKATVSLARLAGEPTEPTVLWWVPCSTSLELDAATAAMRDYRGVRRWLAWHQLGRGVSLASPGEHAERAAAVTADRRRTEAEAARRIDATRRDQNRPLVEAWQTTVLR